MTVEVVLETVSDAPEYVPGGMFTSASGSNEPAWCTNSTSADFDSMLPVVAVPPLPVSVSELTVSSNLTIWSLTASLVLMVALVGPAVMRLVLPPQPATSNITATVPTLKNIHPFLASLHTQPTLCAP